MSRGSNPDAIPNKTCNTVKWAAAALVPVIFYLVASSVGLPPEQILFYVLSSVALALWGLSLMSDTMVAIALPVAYIVAGLGRPAQVLNSWMSPVGWVVLGGIIFAQIMMSTGLAKRLAVWALHVTRGSFVRLLWGILLAGFLIAPAIPSAMGKAALISVICIGICEAMCLERRSNAASAVVLAGFLAVSTAKIAFLTGGADVTLYVGQMSHVMGKTLSWGEYCLHNFPLVILYAVFSMLILVRVLKPAATSESAACIAQMRSGLGPVTFAEKKGAMLILVLILLLAADKVHRVEAGWVIILLSFIAFIPAMGLMNEGKLQKTSLASVFFVVGCMSIGSVAKVVGAEKTLTQVIAPMLQGSSGTMSVVLSYLSGAALNFLLTPMAAFSAMTVPLTELALQMGMNPIPVMYAFSYGLDQYVFPYEYAILLFFYATGWVSLRHIMAVFALRFVATLIFLIAVAVPYWKFLGLFVPLVK